MSVHDAEPMDIYVDPQGKLWRCVGTHKEPTVIFEEVEGRTPSPVNLMGAQAAYVPQQNNAQVQIIKDRKSGGVGGLMWQGWKRIHRQWREPPAGTPLTEGEKSAIRAQMYPNIPDFDAPPSPKP